MDEQEQFELAKKRVQELKGFYTHLAVYVLVIGFLAIINFVTPSPFPWVIFPAGGWGIGLGIHALNAFVLGAGWEQRKMNEILARQRGEKAKRGRSDEYFE